MNNPKKNNATMKKFIVKLKSDNSVLGTFDTKVEASEFVTEAIDDNQIDTVFDVVCEEKDIDYPLTFSDACKILGITEGTIALKGDNGIAKSAVAFYKLAIIAKAWNKIDGFVPDFSNLEQYKYSPWFKYNSSRAGFVYANTYYTHTNASADIGSLLCFKSALIAHKFGETFTALYNKMFL